MSLKTCCIVGLLGLVGSSPILAQTPTLGVGMAWAPIAGNGFSIRMMPEKGFGFQAGTIFWRNSQTTYFNVGGAILFVLKHAQNTALYIPAGIGYTNMRETYWEPDPNDQYGPGIEKKRNETGIAVGTGVGFTVRAWDEIWASVDLTLVSWDDYFGPMPQFGLHYYFK